MSPVYHFWQNALVGGGADVASFRLLSAGCTAHLQSSAWHIYQVGNLIPHSAWTRLGDNTCANIDVIAAVMGNTSYTLLYISTKGGEQDTYIIPQWDILNEVSGGYMG